MARPGRDLECSAPLIAVVYQFGHAGGYTHGLRDLGRFFVEMRQGDYETPDPGDRRHIDPNMKPLA